MRTTYGRKIIAVLTSLIMAFTLMPSVSLAGNADGGTISLEDVTEADIISRDVDSTTPDNFLEDLIISNRILGLG